MLTLSLLMLAGIIRYTIRYGESDNQGPNASGLGCSGYSSQRPTVVTWQRGCMAESTIVAMTSSRRHDVIACRLRHALSGGYMYACLGTQEMTPRHTYNIPPHFIRMYTTLNITMYTTLINLYTIYTTLNQSIYNNLIYTTHAELYHKW